MFESKKILSKLFDSMNVNFPTKHSKMFQELIEQIDVKIGPRWRQKWEKTNS